MLFLLLLKSLLKFSLSETYFCLGSVDKEHVWGFDDKFFSFMTAHRQLTSTGKLKAKLKSPKNK